ncbi:hypothetical protein T07_13937 [Trichinella nelsoni]|uniref:Uncharacterized protein n=1 Tax=Trichinella nelsoni TaxID=6336 RepID=A0A0V0RW58_9BILA|nr:hypothetical protein T07_13937 [Trichinella nelsoni]
MTVMLRYVSCNQMINIYCKEQKLMDFIQNRQIAVLHATIKLKTKKSQRMTTTGNNITKMA